VELKDKKLPILDLLKQKLEKGVPAIPTPAVPTTTAAAVSGLSLV
jgi:hypothetical protein